MVEFAFSAIAFLMLIFGIMDFGRAIYAYHFVDFAARSATRYAIVHGSTAIKPATTADIQSYVYGLASGLNANATCGSNTTPNARCATTTWTPDNKPGSEVLIKVQYNFQPLAPFLPKAVLPLVSSSQMVISQ